MLKFTSSLTINQTLSLQLTLQVYYYHLWRLIRPKWLKVCKGKLAAPKWIRNSCDLEQDIPEVRNTFAIASDNPETDP